MLAGFFWRQVGDENAIRSSGGCAGGEFLQPHLENWIVVAEKDERDFSSSAFQTANLPNQFNDVVQSRASFERSFRSALNGWTVGQGIAEWDAEFDDVGARFRQSLDKSECGWKRRIAGRDVGNDAHFAGRAQSVEAAC